MTTIAMPQGFIDRQLTSGSNDFGIGGKRYKGQYSTSNDGKVKLVLTEINDKNDNPNKIECSLDKDTFKDFYRDHLVMYNQAQANYNKAMLVA